MCHTNLGLDGGGTHAGIGMDGATTSSACIQLQVMAGLKLVSLSHTGVAFSYCLGQFAVISP